MYRKGNRTGWQWKKTRKKDCGMPVSQKAACKKNHLPGVCRKCSIYRPRART